MLRLHLELVYVLAYVASGEAIKSCTFVQHGWKNEIKKCWNGGEDQHQYTFHLGELSNGMTFDDLNEDSVVFVSGKIVGYTRYRTEKAKVLRLTRYSVGADGNEKVFYEKWGFETMPYEPHQEVAVLVAVTVQRDAAVRLDTTVYAASWGAISCAEIKAYIDKVMIVVMLPSEGSTTTTTTSKPNCTTPTPTPTTTVTSTNTTQAQRRFNKGAGTTKKAKKKS